MCINFKIALFCTRLSNVFNHKNDKTLQLTFMFTGNANIQMSLSFDGKHGY